MTYRAPVAIPDEGVHQLGYHSIDHSQNVENLRQIEVRIDLTAPEVVLHYDPIADDLVIEGRDSLSGVAAGPVAPTSRTDVEWTSFGSDVAELRTYVVRDRADNSTTIYIKIRCAPHAYEASVLAIVYDDAAHNDRDASAVREEVASLAHRYERSARTRTQRNTLIFERLMGRNAAAPLLGVKQIAAIGERDTRRTVRARWDALDDYTILVRETGAGSCAPCRDLWDEDDEPHAPQWEERYREEQRERDEHGCDDVDVQKSGNATDTANNGQLKSGQRHHKPCGPTVVSETDICGMVVLHVVSEDGLLYVME